MEPTIYPPTPTETEIFKIKGELSTIGLSGLTGKDRDDISELRSFVLLVHDDCEELLVSIITKKLYVTVQPSIRKTRNYPSFCKKVDKLLKNNTFARLMMIAYDIGAVDQEILEDLRQLRKLRVIFAHLRDKRYLNFKDLEQQALAYHLLWKVTREIKMTDFGFRGLKTST